MAITIHLAFLFSFIAGCKEPRLNYPITAVEGKLLIFSISHPNAVILIATFQAFLQMLNLSYHLFYSSSAELLNPHLLMWLMVLW